MTPSLISPVSAKAAELCAIADIIPGVFEAIWPFIGIAVFGMFLYGGAMWMMSAGNPQGISKAVSTMLWAFIGAVILAMVMVILGTFETILGLPEGSLRAFDIGCVRMVVGV